MRAKFFPEGLVFVCVRGKQKVALRPNVDYYANNKLIYIHFCEYSLGKLLGFFCFVNLVVTGSSLNLEFESGYFAVSFAADALLILKVDRYLRLKIFGR